MRSISSPSSRRSCRCSAAFPLPFGDGAVSRRCRWPCPSRGRRCGLPPDSRSCWKVCSSSACWRSARSRNTSMSSCALATAWPASPDLRPERMPSSARCNCASICIALSRPPVRESCRAISTRSLRSSERSVRNWRSVRAGASPRRANSCSSFINFSISACGAPPCSASISRCRASSSRRSANGTSPCSTRSAVSQSRSRTEGIAPGPSSRRRREVATASASETTVSSRNSPGCAAIPASSVATGRRSR